MRLRGRLGCALVGMAVSLFVAGSAESANTLAESDYSGRPSRVKDRGGVVEDTRHGRGWRSSRVGGSDVSGGSLVLDLAGLGLNRKQGAFDFTLVRGQGQDQDEENIFTLLGASELEPLFVLNVIWDDGHGMISSGGPEVNRTSFQTVVEGKGKSALRSTLVPLPGTIGRGEMFRLTVTWGPSPSDNDLYLNGHRVGAELSDGFDLSGIIERSTQLVIGEEIGPPMDGQHGGYHSQLASTLLDFRMLDAPSTAEREPIAIAGVAHNVAEVAGFSGKLVAGDTVHVRVSGTPGMAGTFDVARYADFDRTISLDWKGFGVYLDDKPFLGEGEVDLHDVRGYQVYASETPFSAVTAAMVPAQTLEVQEQSFVLEDLNLDVPYYVAVYAEMRDGTLLPVIAPRADLPLAETAPGAYVGKFTVAELENYAKAVVVGRLTRGLEVVSLAAVAEPFAIDTAMRLEVSATPEVLKADEKSTADVTVTVTDANGEAASGRKVKFVLATTSQYTGVVGGGAFSEQVGGSLVESSWSETDVFGRVRVQYVAGFAAKTAIIVARDMLSNATGSTFISTFIQSAAELELLPVDPVVAAEGYQIRVTSSDEWLTADGRSEARITARVTLGGEPVQGRRVAFSVSSGAGSVRATRPNTDEDGEAHAIYTAGTKIGLVLVTATDTAAGVSGSVQIELRSDAPAKIAIRLSPDKIPADGSSTSTLQVTVTDINDNPNENTEVEYRIASGGGRLRDDTGVTDRRGESETEYVAGRAPGKVSIEITVRSGIPTDEEMAKARDLALLPSADKFF